MTTNRHAADEVNERLKVLRARYNLTRVEIAEVTGYAKTTVDMWLYPSDSEHARKMPEKALRLLELELGIEAPRFIHLRDRAEELSRALKEAG